MYVYIHYTAIIGESINTSGVHQIFLWQDHIII
jgi:hypothetical protein